MRIPTAMAMNVGPWAVIASRRSAPLPACNDPGGVAIWVGGGMPTLGPSRYTPPPLCQEQGSAGACPPLRLTMAATSRDAWRTPISVILKRHGRW